MRCWWVESGSGVVGQELNHCGEWRMKIKQMWNQLRYCLLVLVVRVENWDLGKGKRGYWGWGLWVECRGHQGLGTKTQEVSNFFLLWSNLWNGSGFTEFDRFRTSLPILSKFDRFRVFNSISHVIYMLTRKIIRFYESTHDFDNNDQGYS